MQFDTITADIEAGAFNASDVSIEVQFRPVYDMDDGWNIEELELVSMPFGGLTLDHNQIAAALGNDLDRVVGVLTEQIQQAMDAGDYGETWAAE